MTYGSSDSALLAVFAQTLFQRVERGQELRLGESWLLFYLPEVHSEAAVNILGCWDWPGSWGFTEAPWSGEEAGVQQS